MLFRGSRLFRGSWLLRGSRLLDVPDPLPTACPPAALLPCMSMQIRLLLGMSPDTRMRVEGRTWINACGGEGRRRAAVWPGTGAVLRGRGVGPVNVATSDGATSGMGPF